jgi:hypothetical protein
MADVDTPQFDAGDDEAQDRAETLDETNLTEDGEEIANFDDIPDVYDATAAAGDADEDDPADDAPLEDRNDEGADIDLEPLAAHNRTSDNPEIMPMSEQPRSFEPKSPNPAEADEAPKAPPSKLSTDKQLDHGLKETFPASDPVSINPGAD